MNIEKFIASEAGGENQHDKYYSEAIRKAYVKYKSKSKADLIELQVAARKRYAVNGSSHSNTAACVVIMKLLEDY